MAIESAPQPWRANPCPSRNCGHRLPGKGEYAARSVHERIMNERTDKDVDELQRIASILNPASVTPSLTCSCWSFVRCTLAWSRKEHITVLEARALAQLVSIIGRQPRGHVARVLILSDSLAVILASTKGALFASWTLSRPS